MKLNELFNTTAGLRKVEDDEDVDYLAQLPDGTHLKIMFGHMLDDEYECTFARGKRSDFADASFDKTGMGSEAQVFGVVIQAITQFLNEYKPGMVSFTASKSPTPDEGEPEDQRKMSRTNLYARMLSRVNDPNYTIKTVKYAGFDEYKIVQKNTEAAKRADRYDRAFGSDLT